MLMKFMLTKLPDLVISHYATGSYINGDWVAGTVTTSTIQASVQPFNSRDVLMMMESDRSQIWVKVYTTSPLTTMVEGITGADQFTYGGDTYKIMQVRKAQLGVNDHYRAIACKLYPAPLGGHL